MVGFSSFICVPYKKIFFITIDLPPRTSHVKTRLLSSNNGPTEPATSLPDASYTRIWWGGTVTRKWKCKRKIYLWKCLKLYNRILSRNWLLIFFFHFLPHLQKVAGGFQGNVLICVCVLNPQNTVIYLYFIFTHSQIKICLFSSFWQNIFIHLSRLMCVKEKSFRRRNFFLSSKRLNFISSK